MSILLNISHVGLQLSDYNWVFDYISIKYYAHLFRKLSIWLWHFARNFDISPEMSIHFWYFSRIYWYFSRNANLFPPINYKIKIRSFYQIIMHRFYHQIVSFSPSLTKSELTALLETQQFVLSWIFILPYIRIQSALFYRLKRMVNRQFIGCCRHITNCRFYR